MSFRASLSNFWSNLQSTLFPSLERDFGDLTPEHKKLIAILELVRIEEYLPSTRFNDGRPQQDRAQIARAYIAKIVLKIPYTKQLIKYLKIDKKLRIICGWHAFQSIPSESKFSRAFQEFAQSSLPDKVHQALIKGVYQDQVVGHVVKDSTPLEVREKYKKKDCKINPNTLKSRKRRNRNKNVELNRRERQMQETDLNRLLEDLPKECDKGCKKSAQGYLMTWKGYKLHAAVDDHCIPLAVIISSASLNDCEAAIPLASKAHQVATNFYDLMDAAYDHPEIKAHSIALGHVPLIDKCPKDAVQKSVKEEEKQRAKILNFSTAESRRYKERLPKERFNALYKDYCGGSKIIYRGFSKVSCHVMFGVLTLAASTIISLL
jgi:hypothetical protein